MLPRNAPILSDRFYLKVYGFTLLGMYIGLVGAKGFKLRSEKTIMPVLALATCGGIMIITEVMFSGRTEEEFQFIIFSMLMLVWASLFFMTEDQIKSKARLFFTSRLGRIFTVGSLFWMLCAFTYVVVFDPFSKWDWWEHTIKLMIIPPALALAGIGMFKYFLKEN